MWQPSLITEDIRLEFRQLKFSRQVKFIGRHARAQLRSIDELILEHLPKGSLTAAGLWKELVDQGKDSDLINSQKISKLHPELESISKSIEREFAEAYVFWNDNYYSCEPNGNLNASSYRASPTLILFDCQKELIDKKSGMPYLGQMMEQHAFSLYYLTVISSYKMSPPDNTSKAIEAIPS
jgi:hypothetical protein